MTECPTCHVPYTPEAIVRGICDGCGRYIPAKPQADVDVPADLAPGNATPPE